MYFNAKETMPMIHLVINPTAGAGRATRIGDRVIAALQEKKIPFTAVHTAFAGEGEALARQAAQAGAETVFAVGGDGTVLEVARGLYGTQAALGIIPAGTGNDVVKTLGFPKSPLQALEYQLGRPSRALDAMAVNGTLSLNVTGTGFDVSVLDYAQKAKKYVRGLLPYLWGVLCTVVTFRPPEIEAVIDGERICRKLLVVSLANGRFIGGGIPIAPMAKVDDGLLTVITVDRLPNWRMPFQLGRLLGGNVMRIPGAQMRSCRRATIRCAGMRLNIDGEILPMDSAQVEILPNALRAHW